VQKQAAGAGSPIGIYSRREIKMYLIKAGAIEINDSTPLKIKGQAQDFEQAKRKAHKLLKTFDQVEIIDSGTSQCVHFLTTQS
jgi:hypothetical protein